MTAARFTIGGLSVPLTAGPVPAPAVAGSVTMLSGAGPVVPLRLVLPQDRVCPWGAPPPCGVLAEPGEGNPDGYCSQHLDAMAGEQEDWESDEEYARRRRMLCPCQLGGGLPGIEWCPEPSDPGSDDGWCLVHNPDCDPSDPQFDPDAARHHLDELVPCLQCRGYPGCEMCGGVGRISLRTANWHRGDDDCAGVSAGVPGSAGSGGSADPAAAAAEPGSDPAAGWTLRHRVATWAQSRRSGLGEAAMAVLGRWMSGTTLTRQDRPFWEAASTLNHLCGLTSLWLQGEIVSQPGYYGPADVDEDQAPGLTAALVACNRAGFLTRDSQAGFEGEGFDGARWTLVAAVAGYASGPAAERLQMALAGSGYRIQVQPVTRHGSQGGNPASGHADEGIPVTRREGQPYTVFGRAGADIDFDLQGCSPAARAAVRAAQQIVIWDPVPGRNTLWEHVRQALGDGGIG